MRFQDTSLDPYLRFFEPRLSPFTTAVAERHRPRRWRALRHRSPAGRARASNSSNLKLFDYALDQRRADRAVAEQSRARDRPAARRRRRHPAADGRAACSCTTAPSRSRPPARRTSASFRGSSATCAAAARRRCSAQVKGPLANPQFSGSARIADGRIRHLSAPHGLEGDQRHHLVRRHAASGSRTSDRARGRRPGRVRRAHRPRTGSCRGQLNLTAVGEQMRAPLSRRASPRSSTPTSGCAATSSAPVLGGSVVVHDAVWTRRFEVDPNIFDLGRRRDRPAVRAGRRRRALPLRFDIQVTANNTLRIQNNLADVVASADLGCRAPTIGRRSSAAPRSTAAASCSRATATS